MLKIITLPNQILRNSNRKIDKITPAIKAIIDQMITTMRQAAGVGLAAPQISKNWRLVILEYKPEKDEDEIQIPLQILINPKIISASRQQELMVEGCLSIPGKEIEVPRAYKIKVQALDLEGNKIQFRASGLHARIIQHELDHLMGKLIVDYEKTKKRPRF